jgi:vancomycin resistance protein YoaR
MSATETTGSQRLRRRHRRILVRRLVAVLLVGIGILTAVGLAFAGSDAVLPAGASIAGVDVGGLTTAAAVAKLEQRAETLRHAPVVFAAGEAELGFSASQLGVRADWAGAAAELRRSAGGFGPLRGMRRLGLRLLGKDVAPGVVAYRGAVSYAVDQLAAQVDHPPIEARVVRRRDGSFETLGGKPGRRLDRASALDALVATLGALERPGRVELPVRTQAPAVRAADLRGALAQARLAVSAPLRLTDGSTTAVLTPKEAVRLLRLPGGGARDVEIGGRAAEVWFERLAARIARPPRSAGWELRADGGVRVVPAVDGIRLDISRTLARLEQAAFHPGDRSVRIAVRAAEPSRTTEEAKRLGIREVVSSYTTAYGGTPGRVHNVRLVAELIDGALIAPDDVFSFNEVTGERNASRGFEEAPVIINGEVQTGIGGGVCQVSTTVFNAAFEAGLPIADRTNHALYIAHYPLGRDATVNYPDIDLRFVNDTGAWLLVRTFVGEGALTVKLLGRSPGRRIETESSPLAPIGKTPFKVIRDPKLVRGTRIVEQIGTHPRQATVRRRVYATSGELMADHVWYSNYVGEPTIVRVGTKPGAAPLTPGGVLPIGQPAGTPASPEAQAPGEAVTPPASPLPQQPTR